MVNRTMLDSSANAHFCLIGNSQAPARDAVPKPSHSDFSTHMLSIDAFLLLSSCIH